MHKNEVVFNSVLDVAALTITAIKLDGDNKKQPHLNALLEQAERQGILLPKQ